MQWEQRKPLWPSVAALSMLFILAIAAPHSWQGAGSQQDLEVASSRDVKPLFPIAPLKSPVTTPAETQCAPVAATPFEPLPVRREFDFLALRQLRDMLLAIVDQTPISKRTSSVEAAPSIATTSTAPSLPQVRVSSEYDRLAMLPRRASILVREPAGLVREPAGLVREPAAAPPVEIAGDEVDDFAAVLLEASRKLKPIATITAARPRLAQRKLEPKRAEVRIPVEPQLAPPEPVQPPLIEPSPLQHRPQALIEQLESFSVNSPGALWSQHVLNQLRPLIKDGASRRRDVTETLNQLEQLYLAGISQAENPLNAAIHNPWQQAAQALGRRLVLWRLLLDPEQPMVSGELRTSTTLLPVLDEIATLLQAEENGSAWREYLLLDQIAAATSVGMSSAPQKRTKLAQEVLSRMEDPQLTVAQREFLATGPLVQYHQELRPWAAGRVNLETLAALVERYETGRETRFATAIAQLQQRLKWSDSARLQALAAHLERHYRGANMRIAMSDDLLNRMVPKQEPVVTPVRDRIAGAKVRGRARTTTKLRVRLVPDSAAWHFGLEAFGKVYSDTRSDTWPARIRNAAKLQYQGRKEISIDKQGLHVSPAQAQAQGRNELLSVDSQLDPMPILGHLLRDMARQKHHKSRPAAITQAKAKVVRQVKQRMNDTTDQKLEALEQKFREKVLAPIEQLALLAEPLDMHTTDERAVMQLRLANIGQLAAHTPRPLAPSDSVLSLQLHETALNNAMMGLGLNGRRMTLVALFEFFTEQFGQAGALPPEDLPRAAVIEFATRDTFRVQCDGDRLELILNIAELSHRRDKIRNFQVHVHFRPVLSGLDVRLVRDGTLQFSGRRLKTGPRVVLHSVIGKLLVKDQEIKLLNADLLTDPRLTGLMVTQLVIEDGWIGMALGPAHPRRTAWQSPKPEVLPTPFVR